MDFSMKKITALLVGLLALPAFAEVVPADYYDTPEYQEVVIDDEFVADDVAADEDFAPVAEPTAAAPVQALSPTLQTRAAISRSAARTVPATNANAVSRNTVAARPVASRTVANQVNSTRGTVASASRADAGQNSAAGITARRNVQASGTSVGRAATVAPTRTSAGTLTNVETVNNPVYTGFDSARVGARAGSIRSAAVRSGTTAAVPEATVAAPTGPTMDEVAQLTDFCKAQYTQCMDNFCDVLDDNQGRCSCSANIKNYAKSEKGLKDATEELQKVANDIKYIGLTKEEVLTLFTQTEAEVAMSGKTDNSALKTGLDKVANMIFDVKSGTATTSDGDVAFDLTGLLTFNMSGSAFDLSSFLGGNNGATESISNQRGAELYKTAAARCKKSVLDTCKTQGVDVAILTNAYNLEIDKQCVAYERNLDDANLQMTRTVTNAKQVLKQARLVVAQQKNTYTDMRSCINALDSCMQDDFVCGSDYEQCLDPTGKYIVNGKVVSGGAPGAVGSTTGLYDTWTYNNVSQNAWSSSGTTTGNLREYIDKTLNQNIPTKVNVSSIMSVYLQDKIGYVTPSGVANGMCISVLNKCQKFTYSTDAKSVFVPKNNVVVEYLNRTLTNIKARQDEIIAKYAQDCRSELLSCLASNNTQNYYSSGTQSQLTNSAMNACRSLATTCNNTVNNTTGKTAEDGFMSDVWMTQNQTGNTITYVTNGGSWKSGLQPPYSYDATSAAYTLLITTGNYDSYMSKPETDATNAVFAGWYTDSACTSAITSIAKGMSGSLTLYAKWTTTTTTCTSPAKKDTSGCLQYCHN
jgi:uncharacterized repeat protein (TIGR02543 family)